MTFSKVFEQDEKERNCVSQKHTKTLWKFHNSIDDDDDEEEEEDDEEEDDEEEDDDEEEEEGVEASASGGRDS